jgi:hypothetical protein
VLQLALLLFGFVLLVGCGGGAGVPSGGKPIVFSNSNITITSYSPQDITTVGLTAITITGTNFLHVALGGNVYGQVQQPGFLLVGNQGGFQGGFVQPPTSTTAIVESPPLSVGTYDLYLVSSAGGAGPTLNTLVGKITVSAPPAVTSLSPTSGPLAGGNTVTINGRGFTAAENVNFVGGSGQPVQSGTNLEVKSDELITVTAPPGTGTVHVEVVTPIGSSSPSSTSVYNYTAAAPVVNSFTPTTGPTAGGNTVTVYGSGFTGAEQVQFDTVLSQGTSLGTDLKVISGSELTVTAPPGSGQVAILVVTPAGTSQTPAVGLYVYDTVPAVTSVTPASGPPAGGNSVTVQGKGFLGAGFGSVTFGPKPATNVVVVSDSQISATAPQGTGTVDVKVTTEDGVSAANSADKYTYTTTALPTVTKVTPSTVPEPYTVPITITGTGFTGATVVSFVGSGSTILGSEVHVISDTQITVMAPTTLSGTYNVVVTTPVGNSPITSADLVTFT